jgi:hypothetical protein
MTPEQRKTYEAQKAATAKRIADAKALRDKQMAAARVNEAQAQAKERVYVAGLPKLWSGSSNEVLVATSQDCARDYKAIVEFGRKNGTGIEFRKRIVELVSLGCAVYMPAGTAIVVSRKDADYVRFCAHGGTMKGTCGIALSEHVH